MHDPHSERMSGSETRAASGLALVFAFRMLGMFMVLPVLATYGMDLAGATPALIGLAIGAYGLTQAIFQIPFGIISDRIGRRPVIYLGLIVFALGSVLAAQLLGMADHLTFTLAARGYRASPQRRAVLAVPAALAGGGAAARAPRRAGRARRAGGRRGARPGARRGRARW